MCALSDGGTQTLLGAFVVTVLCDRPLVFLTGYILTASNHNEPGIFALLFLDLLLEKP
jgi:hypothetical protein